jgi:hypothetical protein
MRLSPPIKCIIERLASDCGGSVSTVKAYPRKQFFIEMFTRDITLEDRYLPAYAELLL